MSSEGQITRSTQITVALIGAGGLIIAALIGLAVHQSGSDKPPSGRPSNAGTATSNTASPSPNPTASTPSSSVTLVWHHRVRFPYGTGLHLNNDQPKVQPAAGADFSTANYGDNTIPAFSLQLGQAGIVSKPSPSFSECMNSFVSEAQGNSILTRVGQSVCFESQDGTRIAAVTVLAWDQNTWAMYADVTVWQVTGP